MSGTTQRILHWLKQQEEEMQREVFAHPPANYEAFSARLGAWQHNQAAQQFVIELIRSAHQEDL